MDDLQRYLEIWTAYAEGGIEAVASYVTDDVVWEEYAGAPGAEIWHGPEGVIALNRKWQEDFVGFRFEPTGAPVELAPGTLAAPVSVKGTGRASGIQSEWNIFMVGELRGGRIAKVFYTDSLDEARARVAG